MRLLKLHTKTTLLVSAITLSVLVAMLLTVSARVVDLVQEEQRALAEWRAVSLAEHISNLPVPRDPDDIAQAVALTRGVRPSIVSVRIWDRAGDGFVERTASAGSMPSEGISPEIAAALISGQHTRAVSRSSEHIGVSFYSAFAPITEHGRVTGAVEIVERLDNIPSIARRYAHTALWLALVALGLITLATYILFRDLVYQPIEHLLDVIARAKSGEFTAQAPERRHDELGRLSQEFNAMLNQIHEMTSERERQQEVLRERVREATAQLQQRNEQLEATNAELWRTTRRLTQLERLAAAGQTAAQFAHEVGTPLNLISCHAQLMQTELDCDPAAARERTEIIIEQIDRIERIVRRMLDRTRAESAELQPLDLNALLKRITEATAPTLTERHVRLDASFDPQLPSVAGDADRLQQVFINLINNALDAMPEGGVLSITTECEPSPAGPRVAVTVTDNGCGMSPQIQAHIFDPLYTTKERGKGTGLGLVVVNQVMQEHGGSVAVESAPGHGSRFRLLFPAVAARTVRVGVEI